jgi:ribonuclease HI
MKITAYTDGSAITNGERLGGYGIYIIYEDGIEEYLNKGYKNTTISRMEMKAILFCIKHFPKNKEIDLHIYSDSQFICKSFNEKWIDKWQKENFIGRANKDIWLSVLKELKERPLLSFKITHTRGHRKDIEDYIAFGNHIADMLANYKNFTTYIADNK